MPRLATVLDAVSDASLEIGIVQRPVTNVVGTADQDIAQMTALLQNVADELLIDPPYRDQLGDGNWLIDTGMQVFKSRPTADTDVILFDPRLVVDGLKYRFLKAKGLEYGEEQRDFITRLNKIAGRNAPVLDLNEDVGRIQ
jgi:hypothetical protein